MGFFGFLKKKDVEPPKSPDGKAPGGMPSDVLPLTGDDSAMAMPKDDLGEIPPLPAAPTNSPGDLPPMDGLPPPPPSDAPQITTQTNAPQMMPPINTVPQQDSLLDSSQAESDMNAPPGELLDTMPDAPSLPELDKAPAAGDVPVETPVAEAPEMKPATLPLTDLPDFTDEEIAEAERLEAGESGDEELDLPAFEEVEDAENLVIPKREPIGNLFVPAIQYKEALKSITAMRKATKKGDGSLKKLSDTIVSNKEPFTQYAERLNSIQENLILMDNTLVNQR